MVVLVSGQRQPEAFDGVADEAGRLFVVGVVESFEQRRQIMPAEIVHQRSELVVVAVLD